MEKPSPANNFQARHVRLLLSSFRRFVGRPLIDEGLNDLEAARQIFFAPFVVLSHDAQADPHLTYGNKAALELWETDWTTLTGMPSRLTAEPVHRDERRRLLERTNQQGFIDNYSGIRVSVKGRRFQIEGATLWNLINAMDERVGQAAMFERYRFL
jgi:hypothetical protein